MKRNYQPGKNDPINDSYFQQKQYKLNNINRTIAKKMF
jgi:hypothetical protein